MDDLVEMKGPSKEDRKVLLKHVLDQSHCAVAGEIFDELMELTEYFGLKDFSSLHMYISKNHNVGKDYLLDWTKSYNHKTFP